jgi:uncharacterized integral membrane protein
MTEPGQPGPTGPPPPDQPRRRNEARAWLIVITLALGVAWVIAFAVENTTNVPIHWVFGTTHSSLIWVIFVCLALGALLGVLAVYLRRRARGGAKPPDD